MSELTPYICVEDSRAAIEWYVDVLGAEVTYEPIEMPDGRIGHVELAVDGAGWMMSDEFAEANVAAPDRGRGQRGVAPPHRRRRRRGRRPGGRRPASRSTAAPRTARRRDGSRCSATRSGTGGSSTSRRAEPARRLRPELVAVQGSGAGRDARQRGVRRSRAAGLRGCRSRPGPGSIGPGRRSRVPAGSIPRARSARDGQLGVVERAEPGGGHDHHLGVAARRRGRAACRRRCRAAPAARRRPRRPRCRGTRRAPGSGRRTPHRRDPHVAQPGRGVGRQRVLEGGELLDGTAGERVDDVGVRDLVGAGPTPVCTGFTTTTDPGSAARTARAAVDDGLADAGAGPRHDEDGHGPVPYSLTTWPRTAAARAQSASLSPALVVIRSREIAVGHRRRPEAARPGRPRRAPQPGPPPRPEVTASAPTAPRPLGASTPSARGQRRDPFVDDRRAGRVAR